MPTQMPPVSASRPVAQRIQHEAGPAVAPGRHEHLKGQHAVQSMGLEQILQSSRAYPLIRHRTSHCSLVSRV